MIRGRQFERFGNCYVFIDINLEQQAFTSARTINASLSDNIQEEMRRELQQGRHYKIQYVAKCQFKRTVVGQEREDVREQFLSLSAQEAHPDSWKSH